MAGGGGMKGREDKIRIETKWECINDASYTLEIDKNDFKKLCGQYGIYGIDWYFVSPRTIKYFDDKKQAWDYIDVFNVKISVVDARA